MAAIHHPSNFQLIISLQTSKGLMPPKHARSRFDKGHPPRHLKKKCIFVVCNRSPLTIHVLPNSDLIRQHVNAF